MAKKEVNNISIAKIALIVLAILLFFYFFLLPSRFYAYYVYPLNDRLNSLKSIDRSCYTDQDCKMYATDCSLCVPGGGAVNKDYKPFCPLPYPIGIGCPAVEPNWAMKEAVCENNVCVEKQINRDFIPM